MPARHSAGEALTHLESNHPDVVLLDLNLEDSAGYETFYRVRQAASRAAILVLSGSDDEELAIKTVREGAQDYLVKGTFDGRLLLRSIRYAIERKRSEEACGRARPLSAPFLRILWKGSLFFPAMAPVWTPIPLRRTGESLANELIGCRLCDFCEKGFEEVWAELRLAESGRGQFWAHLKGRIAQAGGLLLYGEHSSRPASGHAA